jgi:hypothetical protein
MFARIGSVCRRSTMPLTTCSGLSNASREALTSCICLYSSLVGLVNRAGFFWGQRRQVLAVQALGWRQSLWASGRTALLQPVEQKDK